jgi:hypothetical protein
MPAPTKHTMLILCLVGFLPGSALAQGPAPTPAAATVLNSEQFVLHSKVADADFVIQVARLIQPPAGAAKLPAIYLLDGTYLFPMAAPVATLLPFEQAAQPAYVIGIGFPETDFWLTANAATATSSTLSASRRTDRRWAAEAPRSSASSKKSCGH